MAAFTFVGIFTVVFVLYNPVAAVFKCTDELKKHADTDDTTCQTYIECTSEGWQPRKCAAGFVFYEGLQWCVPEHSYDCSPDAPKFVCRDMEGDFPDPRNCSRYYYCYRSYPLHRICPFSESFNPALRSCDPMYNCSEKSEVEKEEIEPEKESVPVVPVESRTVDTSPLPPCRIPDGRMFANINQTCHYFFQCKQGKATLEKCQDDFNFYPGLDECVPADYYDCHAPRFLCPFPNNDFPDLEDCHRYYRCHGFWPLRLTCANGMVFNPHPKISACVPGNDFNCHSSQFFRNPHAVYP